MKIEAKKNIRPYWHVDAKWICGLVFMFLFGLSLFTWGLYQITNPKSGIDIMTKMITLAFSRDGIDSTKDIDEVKAKLAASPTKTVQPNPALNVTLTEEDIAGKTPREIRYLIFSQVATPIYYNGKGAEEVLNTSEARANFKKDTFLLRLFSESSHKAIRIAMITLSLLSAVFLGMVVFFSARFGRIANPGFVIFASSWFWALFFVFLTSVSKNFSDTAISFGQDSGYGTMIGPFVREVVPDIAQVFARFYLYPVFAGLFLLLLATVGKMFLKKYLY
jgi:hypothetical protein